MIQRMAEKHKKYQAANFSSLTKQTAFQNMLSL